MSKFWFGSTALAVLLAASGSAMAGDVSGHVDVYGTVTPTCSVSSPLEGSINLGELAGADGHLLTALTGSAGPFTVMCNSSAPVIQLSATSMVGTLTPADSTYTNVVGFTAHLLVTEAGASHSETFNAISANVASPPVTSATLAYPLAGTSGNVSVNVDTLNSANAILTAGQYGVGAGGTGGVISITITPA